MSIFDHFKKKQTDTGSGCTVIVPAAGSSTRMGEDKLMHLLGGIPVLIRTLWVLEACPEISEIIVVTREEQIVPVSQMCRDSGLTRVRKVIRGGDTRAESVLAGLHEADPDSELIAIHDGARPFVTTELISRTIRAAAKNGAAAPGVPVKDTIKRVVNGIVEHTPDRSELFAIQTPQIFEHGLILGALEKAVAEKAPITDDCSAVELLGMPVFITEGSYENIKLTTPDDMIVAEAILERREKL